MIAHALRFTLPAAYALLPVEMGSSEASALLLAIGLQESRFLARRQVQQGPARGFWQFERGGIAGVLRHPLTAHHVKAALRALRYGDVAAANATRKIIACHTIVEHHDPLACVFARLLLWTLPAPLPTRDEPDRAWNQYLDAWRPGRPHPETWPSFYAEAWDRVAALEAG